MITLTTPPGIFTVLGSGATVPYDKINLTGITADPIAKTIRAQVQASASGDPSGTVIQGNLDISVPNSKLSISLPPVDFHRTITLTAGQKSFVSGMISDLQDALEGGLVTLALVDGVQATGVLASSSESR